MTIKKKHSYHHFVPLAPTVLTVVVPAGNMSWCILESDLPPSRNKIVRNHVEVAH